MNDKNDNKDIKWHELEAEPNENPSGAFPEDKTKESIDDDYEERINKNTESQANFLEQQSEAATSKKTNTKKSTQGKKGAGGFVLATLTLAIIGGSLFAYKKYSDINQEKVTTASIEEVRTNIESNLATVEEKLVDVVNERINPLDETVVKLKEKVTELEILILATKKSVDQQQTILTALSENEAFNSELVSVINKSVDDHELSINAMKKFLNSLDKDIKSISKRPFAMSLDEKSKEVELKTVSDFKLFAIDMWGTEKVAVFTKGNLIQKVKMGEFIESYFVESINSTRGEVSLSKDKKRYLVSIR
jgi:uncharacterized coiled-coil protein SlyX